MLKVYNLPGIQTLTDEFEGIAHWNGRNDLDGFGEYRTSYYEVWL
jgi:hypothetical protein